MVKRVGLLGPPCECLGFGVVGGLVNEEGGGDRWVEGRFSGSLSGSWLGWLAKCKSVSWAPQFAQCIVSRLTDSRANLFAFFRLGCWVRFRSIRQI